MRWSVTDRERVIYGEHSDEDLLGFAFDVVAVLIGAAVTVDRALGVELVVALAVGRCAAVAPDALALHAQRRAVAVEAVALACEGCECEC